MKKNRLIIIALLSVFTALMLAGCQTQASGEDSQSSEQQTAEASQAQPQSSASAVQEDNAVYGTVTAIDGNTVTLELGTLNENAQLNGQDGPGQGGGQNGKPSGSAPSDMPSDMPSGDMPSDMPSGEMPSDMPSDGERPSMLTSTGETITITIPDESIITVTGVEGQETGLAAIQEGSTLKIVYAQDGETIQSVVVLNGGDGFSGGGQNAPQPS